MGNRVLNLTIASLKKILKSENLENNQHKESLILIGRERFYQNIYENFWKIRLDEDLMILEIEFLKELGDTEINILDQLGNIIYELQMTIVSSLHIIIDIKDWDPGIYSIDIKDFITKEKTSSCDFSAAYLLIFGNPLFHNFQSS